MRQRTRPENLSKDPDLLRKAQIISSLTPLVFATMQEHLLDVAEHARGKDAVSALVDMLADEAVIQIAVGIDPSAGLRKRSGPVARAYIKLVLTNNDLENIKEIFRGKKLNDPGFSGKYEMKSARIEGSTGNRLTRWLKGLGKKN
jgi:hypothetical protein